MKATESYSQEMISKSCSRQSDARRVAYLSCFRLLAVIVIMFTLAAAAPSYSYAVDHIYQKSQAISVYDTSGYQLIYNPKVSRAGGGEGRSIMKSVSGPEMDFRTLIYTGIPNPQSIAVSPDGRTAWVMSSGRSGNDNKRTGRIYKVDIGRYLDAAAGGDDADDAVTAGPLLVVGHGQTLAYNPADDTLWYVRETKVENTTLVQVDPDTMEILKEIHFKFSTHVDMPPTFAFDRDGNLWTYTRSIGSSWAPAGTIRFYKGTLEDDYVNFVMIKQGLRNPPGKYCQSLGYNAANDRLYVISDGVIYTVPASELGSITEDDVETIVFDGSREFEGMAFDETGCGYFLTNNPSEIMRDEISFANANGEHERIAEVKEQYDTHTKEIEEIEESEKKEIVKDEIGSLLENGI